MLDLFCRVTCSYEQSREALQLIADKSDVCIVYEHNNDDTNVHIHFYLQGCSVSTDTLKNYFKRYSISGGNRGSGWSFKSANSRGCVTYMTKGKLDPVFVKGINQEEIDLLKSQWVDKKSPIKEDKNKTSTPTQYQMAMEVYEIVKVKARDLDVNDHFYSRDIYELCSKVALDILHKNQKGFDVNSIKKVIQPAYTKFEKCRGSFVDRLVRDFFRD